MIKPLLFSLVLVIFSISQFSQASIIIAFDFDGDLDLSNTDATTVANRTAFTDAGVFWTNVLTGYQDSATRTVTITASTFDQAASGGLITLGSAGPTAATATGTGHVVVTAGQASFNVNVAAVGSSGLLDPAVIRHEMGHILGIGTLWELNGLYVAGSGEYTGANALAAYNQEFGQNGLFIPVELDGGGGTADGHWNEVADNPGMENMAGPDSQPGDNLPAPTVVSGINAGESLDDALMTGLLSGSAFLSDATIGGFQDLGYTTIDFNAVPEPSSTVFLGLGLLALMVRRRE